MTTPVRIQQSIRQFETNGLTHTQIARELGVSRTTVVKYATRDYSPVPPTGGTASRSLVAGEYARKADEWLEADRCMPRKQRHTARRVHERLVECVLSSAGVPFYRGWLSGLPVNCLPGYRRLVSSGFGCIVIA